MKPPRFVYHIIHFYYRLNTERSTFVRSGNGAQ